MFLVMVNPLVYTYRNILNPLVYTYRNIFGDDDRPIILGIGNIL